MTKSTITELAVISTKLGNIFTELKNIHEKINVQNGRIGCNEDNLIKIKKDFESHLREEIIEHKHQEGIESWGRKKLIATIGVVGTIAAVVLTFILQKIWEHLI